MYKQLRCREEEIVKYLFLNGMFILQEILQGLGIFKEDGLEGLLWVRDSR